MNSLSFGSVSLSVYFCGGDVQGDRFGGALDAAAKQFSKAFDSGMLPMEFVNKMKKEGNLIMGIGHRVKSVSTVPVSLFGCHVSFRFFTVCACVRFRSTTQTCGCRS